MSGTDCTDPNELVRAAYTLRTEYKNLSAILRKAQGITCAETGSDIDVGGEVVAIRRALDRHHERITELEAALLALVDHVRQGPRIEYWLYDSTPIGAAVRVLGRETA